MVMGIWNVLVEMTMRMLGLPPIEVCESKMSKRFRGMGDTSWLFLFPIGIFLMLLQLDRAINNDWIFSLLFLGTMFLGIILFRYDFVAVSCYRYKFSEYYRASGVTKSDLEGDSDKAKAARGEFASYVLSKKCKVPHKMLYNLCVPMPNGNYQEIDALMITDRGLFVLECKNRGGVFTGTSYDSDTWYQHMGRDTVNETHNIYLQNQGHVYALDNYLQTQGILPFGCFIFNMILTGGDMELQIGGNVPNNFACGDTEQMVEFISEYYNEVEPIPVENVVERIYHELLPYALIPAGARENMMAIRKAGAKQYPNGTWQYVYFECGIPDIVEEPMILRQNLIYTQISTDGENWFTVADLEYR